MTLVVGLTGGIGSGKSTVAAGFAARQVPVVDTDEIAHWLTAPGSPSTLAILDALGSGLRAPDGTLDRRRLRERAFADAGVRATLERILHPEIANAARSAVAAWTAPYGILVVPLLLERGGLRDLVGRILVVDCPESEQIRRAVARSGLTEELVRSIMATQVVRVARLAAADDVIDNSGAPAALAEAIDALDRRYRSPGGATSPPGSGRDAP